MTKEQKLKKIKHSLWVRGYHVRDVSDLNLGYDFIVNDKYRVKLLEECEEKDSSKYDILVAWEKEIKYRPLWIRVDGFHAKRPEDVFGKVEITKNKK
jgi:hypothetical protein